MGAFLSTDVVNPTIVAAGGKVTGNFTVTAPHAGHFYGIMELYDRNLVVIPGTRAYMFQAVAGGPLINSTTDFLVVSPVAVGEQATHALELTVIQSDCYLYLFLKEITVVVIATALVAGTTYKIVALGTTNFTLVGAAANVVGTTFVATGAGAGTGTVCTTPDPDLDVTIDSVNITLESAAPAAGINMSELMNLMITMMIVVMMMKMMMSTMKSV